MKFSPETRILQLEHRLRLLSLNEKENEGLIRKVKRELRKVKGESTNEQEAC